MQQTFPSRGKLQRETQCSVLLSNLIAPLILASDQSYWKYVFKCYFHTERKAKNISIKKHNCRLQNIIEKHFHSLFLFLFYLICKISSRRAVKMPRSDILIQDLSRYIWHFRAAQLHLPLCLSVSPATQTFTLQRLVQNQTFSQLSFSPSSLPLEWTIPFYTTAQWLSFYFSILQDMKCMSESCWNQQLHFTASVFKTFYVITLKKKKKKAEWLMEC